MATVPMQTSGSLKYEQTWQIRERGEKRIKLAILFQLERALARNSIVNVWELKLNSHVSLIAHLSWSLSVSSLQLAAESSVKV